MIESGSQITFDLKGMYSSIFTKPHCINNCHNPFYTPCFCRNYETINYMSQYDSKIVSSSSSSQRKRNINWNQPPAQMQWTARYCSLKKFTSWTAMVPRVYKIKQISPHTHNLQEDSDRKSIIPGLYISHTIFFAQSDIL